MCLSIKFYIQKELENFQALREFKAIKGCCVQVEPNV